MKLMIIALCVSILLILAGCGQKQKSTEKINPPEKFNLLDTANPAKGFVADSYDVSGSALAEVAEEQLTRHDRILDLVDPFLVARLAHAWQRDINCPDPDPIEGCPTSPEIFDALQDAINYPEELKQLLLSHLTVLECWAAVAAAHNSIAIANVLEQTGFLDAIAKQEIRNAADSFLEAEAHSYEILDFSKLLHPDLEDGIIGEEVLSHGPITYPDEETATAADGITDEFLEAVNRLFGEGPLTPLCSSCSDEVPVPPRLGTTALQALRKLRILREYQNRPVEDGKIDAYVDALVVLAESALNNNDFGSQEWIDYLQNAIPYYEVLAPLVNVIDSVVIVDTAGMPEFVSPTVKYEDPNAGGYIPNVATDQEEDYRQSFRPWIRLDTSFDVESASKPVELPYAPLITVIPVTSMFVPCQTDEDEAFDGTTSWYPPEPFKVSWEIHTYAPVDHIDMRITRAEAEVGQPTAHFIYWPIEDEIPTWTILDPAEDPEAPMDPDDEQFVSYEIKAVVVDQRGRASSRACAQVNIRFGPPREDPIVDPSKVQPIPMVDDPIPPKACLPESHSPPGDGRWDLPPNSIEATYYFCDNEMTVTYYRPYKLFVFDTEGILTFINNDVVPHHLCSVYTPPYVEFPDLPSLAIGGIEPLNFGTVQPGGLSTISIPDGAINRTTWILYDLISPNPRQQLVKVRILTQ
jgi:hypothetical protein